jgi:hypothetical protein
MKIISQNIRASSQDEKSWAYSAYSPKAVGVEPHPKLK